SENVARRGFLLWRGLDTFQIVRLLALRPGLQSRRPGLDLLGRIGRRDRVLAALQTRIDEVAGEVGDIRIFRVIGEDDGPIEPARQCDEFRRAETVMTDFDDMPQSA